MALAAGLEHYTAIICQCHLHICRTNHYLSELNSAPFVSERVHNYRVLPTKQVGLTKIQEPMSPNHYNQATAGREMGKFAASNNKDCNLRSLWHTNFTKAFFVFKVPCGFWYTRKCRFLSHEKSMAYPAPIFTETNMLNCIMCRSVTPI